jgi:chromate transporter
MLGCIIGLVGIFLPGTLLVFFAFPIWKKLQTYPIVQRSLDGIFSASVGFILSAALILNHHFWKNVSASHHSATSIVVFGMSLILLISKKVPAPLIVLGTVIAGFAYTRLGL